MPATPYTGRFAPSPTGDLHFGSLVAAVGSFLQARTANGRWLVRIEDLDPPRVVAGSADRILADLHRFGMTPDGPILHQSTRDGAYEDALALLERKGLLFPCACTRSELPPGPYPGTCRHGLPAGRTGRSLRIRVPDRTYRWVDRIQGPREENLSRTTGDFVLRRADGYYAYQLAVVVDDAWQNVTEVVRGADLIGSTARQLFLQEALDLPRPEYAHLPVVSDDDGNKLGKRHGSDPVAAREPCDALGAALAFLGHPPPPHDTLAQRWAWAMRHWDPDRVPAEADAHSCPDGQALYFGNSADDEP